MTVTRATSLLVLFRTRIEEAVGLVPSMYAEEKLKAVQFWNAVSEKLQEIVNSSAADINALALKFENHPSDKMALGVDETNVITQSNVCSSDFINLPNYSLCGESEHQLQNANISCNNIKQFLSRNSSFAVSPENPRNEQSTNLPHIHQLSQEIAISQNQDRSDDVVLLSQSLETNNGIIPFSNQCSLRRVTRNSLEIKLNLKQPSKLRQQRRKTKLSSAAANKKNNRHIKKITGTGAVKPPQVGTTLVSCKSKKLVEQNDIRENSANKRTDEKNIGSRKILTSAESENSRQSSLEDRLSISSADDLEDSTSRECVSFVVSNKEVLENNQENEVVSVKKGDIKLKNHTCEHCNLQFPDNSSLTSHQWTHTKPFKCVECPAKFSTRGNLMVHMRKHTGEKPYGCPQCCNRFTTKGNLKRHIKTHSGEKPWQCIQCKACFTEKKSLNIHMRRHTGEKPYQCQVCFKRFAQTGILQTHMAMHNDQKSHLCEHCGKSFRQKSQLRLHKQRHDGVKKYLCPSCPARFLTKGDLERHERMHTGERPFSCEMCSKGFTRQQSLNEHMNRHYGLTPYDCKYCPRSFSEMSACYKHIKMHEKAASYKLEESQKFLQEVSTTVPELLISSTRSVRNRLQKEQGQVQSQNYEIVLNASENPMESDNVENQSNPSFALIAASTEENDLTNRISDFTAMNLLANTSTDHQTF